MIILHDSSAWTPEDHAALREYLEAHRLLPPNPDKLTPAQVEALGVELLDSGTSDADRTRILITLAHHPSIGALDLLRSFVDQAPPGFVRFARFAAEECSQWVGPDQTRAVASA